MSMSLNSGRGPRAEINMTPMIDVLLVLIIMFMVITPTKSVGLKALVPQEPAQTPAEPAPSHDIVISILADGSIRLNQEPVEATLLEGRLVGLFKHGGSTPVFIRGDKTLEYRQVTAVIAIARKAGIARIALMGN
jgi:biopolymer transport protein TolR